MKNFFKFFDKEGRIGVMMLRTAVPGLGLVEDVDG